jgi:hypothetical protein
MTAPTASLFATDPADDDLLDSDLLEEEGADPAATSEEDLAAEERRKEKARIRAARAQARAAARAIPPERRPELFHLELDELRDYRQQLLAEEDRVSYWRRLLQARLDLLRSEVTTDEGAVAPAKLRELLGGDQLNGGRRALVHIVPESDTATAMPPLPDLARLWETPLAELTYPEADRLAGELEAAEAELSEYRTALHQRLDAATIDLIARYREDPGACLRALPLDD